jgi:uncharacterized SAM-binding protein YcdF (DUF218 family)
MHRLLRSRVLLAVRILCLHPEASTTRVEARAFAELAGREGWRSVTVVTSSYHRHRVGLLVDRCFGGGRSRPSGHPRAAASVLITPFAAREGAALLAALTVQRRC